MTASGLLKDTVVLISGGTQGLGAGIARQAAAEGAAGIAVTGRSAEAGGKIAENLTGLGVPAVFLQADFGDTQQASSMVIRAIEHFGRCVVRHCHPQARRFRSHGIRNEGCDRAVRHEKAARVRGRRRHRQARVSGIQVVVRTMILVSSAMASSGGTDWRDAA